LEAALALSGQNPQFHNLLGTLYAQKEDYEGAIEAWERALTLDPEMEKAYRNIEKAQGMLEEEEVEEERRPFLLVAIALGIVALLCAGAAFYFGSKAYSMKESIADMNTQLENQTNETLAAQKEIQEMRTKQDAVLAQIPGGSFDNLVSKMQELQTQAAQQQSQVSQLTAQRQTEGNALRAQIAQLQQEKARLQDELKRVASLENQVRTEQARVRQLERSLEEKDTQIAQEQQRANDLKSKVALAEETNRSIKSDRDRAISNLTKSNERKVEELRNQILELRGQIAAYENTGNNREQANRLIVEALKNLDSSKFELAQENLSQALTLAPEHTAAAYL
jgi:cell division protein FtsL